jgi:hypothetical protein
VRGACLLQCQFRRNRRESVNGGLAFVDPLDELVDAGYDVWLENWRASIDLPPNEWTLDQAAEHDHPYAVRKVARETGADEVKAVIHCQGSTSFMMSAVAGLVPEVRTIVANAVTLHPVIPRISRFKLRNVVPLVGKVTPYMNPQWGLSAPGATAKALALMVRITHHECDNPVCKMVSFTYGTGFPALWRHENLNAATHEWVTQEFAHVPLSFFRADVEIDTAEPPLDCSISAFGGLQDVDVSVGRLEAWRLQTNASFALRMFPGDHFFVHTARPALLDLLNQELKLLTRKAA